MRFEDIQANCRKMEQRVAAITDWCSSRRLQLKADKTKVIWFGSRANINDKTEVIWFDSRANINDKTKVIGFGSRANIKKLSQMDTKLHLVSIVV